jgi:amidase
LGNVWGGFAQEHVLTRSVRDSAAMLDATAGEDAGVSLACPAQARPYLDETRTPPGKLRVLATLQPFFGTTVHPDCRAAFDDATALMRALGHEVEQGTVPVDGAALARSFLTIVAAEARADIEWAAGVLGRAPRFGDTQADTWALGLLGKHFSAADYANASRALQAATRVIGRVMHTYDLILTPTLGAPPVAIGALQPSAVERTALSLIGRLGAGSALSVGGMLDQMIDKAFGFIPFTPLFNCTGQPAMSVPLWWNANGLPVGTQLVGRFGDEATLFRVAAQLETARPWAERMPAMVTRAE